MCLETCVLAGCLLDMQSPGHIVTISEEATAHGGFWCMVDDRIFPVSKSCRAAGHNCLDATIRMVFVVLNVVEAFGASYWNFPMPSRRYPLLCWHIWEGSVFVTIAPYCHKGLYGTFAIARVCRVHVLPEQVRGQDWVISLPLNGWCIQTQYCSHALQAEDSFPIKHSLFTRRSLASKMRQRWAVLRALRKAAIKILSL